MYFHLFTNLIVSCLVDILHALLNFEVMYVLSNFHVISHIVNI